MSAIHRLVQDGVRGEKEYKGWCARGAPAKHSDIDGAENGAAIGAPAKHSDIDGADNDRQVVQNGADKNLGLRVWCIVVGRGVHQLAQWYRQTHQECTSRCRWCTLVPLVPASIA